MRILNKNKLLFSLIILLAVIFATGVIFDYKFSATEAGISDNVSGWAWSENIGWISFNCTDTASCATSDYGVNIDQLTGNFSGYAWSENIGWIDFAPSSGYPEAPNNGAKLEATGDVTGWAKALSADGNGWDGWIKMSGSWSNGVKLSGSNFTGYAWGSDVIGWIEFNPAFGGVVYGVYNGGSASTCSDGIDNDGDGNIDSADLKCNGGGVSEYACSDGIDDDGDGYTDYGSDPGCISASDTSEMQVTNFSVSSSNDITANLLIGIADTSTPTTLTVNMISTGDPAFGGPVTLSVSASDLPGATTYNFNSVQSSSYNLTSSQYATGVPFSVNVPAGTPDQSYTITIRGSGGGINSYVNVILNSGTFNIKFEEL